MLPIERLEAFLVGLDTNQRAEVIFTLREDAPIPRSDIEEDAILLRGGGVREVLREDPLQIGEDQVIPLVHPEHPWSMDDCSFGLPEALFAMPRHPRA